MMRLSEAAGLVDGQLLGTDISFSAVGIDSRTIRAGDLFVALRGDNFDGHRFISAAAAQGAVAALVEGPVDASLPQLQVADTQTALERLAAGWRQRFELPLIAVTGSNGKTTVKEMIASILAQTAPVLATKGNFNNHIGLPLTLLRLRTEHQWAVIEAGMSAPGELSQLSAISQPTVAVITNAAAAHLEGLGDVAAVARAKGELLEGLRPGGRVILNLDDGHAELWRELAGEHPVSSFSLIGPADFTAHYRLQADGTALTFQTPVGEVSLRLGLLGRHNVSNALAATAAALAAGAPLTSVAPGLEALEPVRGRLYPLIGPRGCQLVDDSYNANPASLQAALEVLALASGRRLLVLGDMAELGPTSADLHRAAGHAARAAGIDGLWGSGPMSCLAAEAFGEGGRTFKGNSELLAELKTTLNANDCVLIKGSRSAAMDQIVTALSPTETEGDN